jgi:hypothetical protein
MFKVTSRLQKTVAKDILAVKTIGKTNGMDDDAH